MATQPKRAGRDYHCYRCDESIAKGQWYTTYTPLGGEKRYYHLPCEGAWGKYMAEQLEVTT